MFHIVFQSRDAEVLTAAMDLDEALDGEILAISDDYSLGPVAGLLTEEGMAARKSWWGTVLAEAGLPDEPDGVSGDQAGLQQILERMREETFDQIWIWVASNARDVSGYYWLVSQLGEFAGRVYLLSLNNLPFISDKGTVFYPLALSEIPPREFIKAKKLARPVTTAEFETDPEEWTRLGNEHKHIRVLEGAKKLVQQEEDYFDAPLKKFVGPDFQKASRIVHQFLSKSPVRTGERFLLWRLKQLAVSGAIEQQGEMFRLPGPEMMQSGTVQDAQSI